MRLGCATIIGGAVIVVAMGQMLQTTTEVDHRLQAEIDSQTAIGLVACAKDPRMLGWTYQAHQYAGALRLVSYWVERDSLATCITVDGTVSTLDKTTNEHERQAAIRAKY